MRSILVSTGNVINGVLVDAVEHFLFLLSKHVQVDLVVVGPQHETIIKDSICKLIDGRYNINFEYRSKINVLYHSSDLNKLEREAVMMFGSKDVMQIPYLTKVKKLVIVKEHTPSLDWYNETCKWYGACVNHPGAVMVREYDLGPLHANDVVTPSLFAFDLYKYIPPVDHGLYLLSLASKGSVESIHEILDNPRCKHLVTYGSPIALKDERLTSYPGAIGDLFSRFGTYVYSNNKSFSDPRPRLFIECAFYDKQVLLLEPLTGRDGATRRWEEYNQRSREEIIEKRNMKLSSPLFKEFLH